MDVPPLFTNSLSASRQAVDTGSVLASGLSKAKSPVSEFNVDLPIGECRRGARLPKPRSRTGCWTCRERKVKCDELRPKCGLCIRLNRDCNWDTRWKFDDLSVRTRRRHRHVCTTGSPSWDNEAQHYPLSRQPYGHQLTLPPFNELENENEREERASIGPPGAFNVILTPESFSRLPEYGGMIRRHRGGSGTPISISKYRSLDPNLVFLMEFEDAPFFMVLPERRDFITSSISRSTGIPLTLHDSLDGRAGDDSRVMTHYKDSISRMIMPLESRYMFNDRDYEDGIILESQSFRPLHHAIYAITLLSLALKGTRHVLVGAFQHYDQAVRSCISSTYLPTRSLIYFHFILLLFDICCPARNSSLDSKAWPQHFQQLACLTYRSEEAVVTQSQAYVLSYSLFLDAQACLAGNLEAGSFVRAYLVHGSSLPTWHKPQGPYQQSTPDAACLRSVFGLSVCMRTRFAELSQLALQMRKDVDMGQGSISKHQESVMRFKDELCSSWNLRYPAFLAQDWTGAGTELPDPSRRVFNVAYLQYSTTIVYLHTSMYRGQRMYTSQLQREETAVHCRQILAMAALAVAEEASEQHYFVFSVFLAGISSTSEHEKAHAIGLIRVMEGASISQNVTKSRELLEMIYAEQRRKAQCGGNAADVDWISFARERGIRLVDLGL